MATGLGTLQHWLVPAATRLFNIAVAAGLTPRVSSARRSHAQQALLYRRFLAGQSRFPAAPPGHSAHELGLAFDLWINDETQFTDLGSVWEQMGGTWGGHFHDPIHFEAGGATHYAESLKPVPTQGGPFYALANFLSGFVPGLGEVQLVDSLVSLLDGNHDLASWYLQHPAEALRDLAGKLF
jgi:hypothetical protein